LFVVNFFLNFLQSQQPPMFAGFGIAYVIGKAVNKVNKRPMPAGIRRFCVTDFYKSAGEYAIPPLLMAINLPFP